MYSASTTETTMDMKTTESDDAITIRGQQVSTRNAEIDHGKLKFFADNPRIYAIVHQNGHEPTQHEIEEILLKTEYVRELMLDIKNNGGLMEPLIVRDGTFEVLEGNSRLAAYRGLAKQDAIAWSKVKCRLLPKDIDESLVFALLGQLHVKGKKAWQPFEQAGFLYRRCKGHKLDYEKLGAEIGLKWKTVKHLVETYQFMLDRKEPPERWSYWDEYLKSYKIARARERQPNLDDVIVAKVKSEEIQKAVLIREELPHICEAPKVLQKFVDGKVKFEMAAEQARNSGTDHVPYKRILKFREFIVDTSCEDAILASDPGMRAKCAYELEKIESRVKVLKAKLKQK
jgi:hypothetical protein